MKLAIVILNWNGLGLLKKYVPLVLEHSGNAEIYVIDNASTDESVTFLEEAYPEVNIVVNDANYGFAGGYNIGLKSVKADCYCLLNSDVKVTKNWLLPIIKGFEELPEAQIIQPKILDLKNEQFFEYAGAAGGFLDKLGYPFCRGRIFQALEKDTGQYDDIKEIFWATGACMFIKSEVFWELNGFDADYFAHQEEVDLCWRAKNKGHKIFYIGASKVYHLGGSTLNNMNPKKTFLNFRNSLYSIIKNLPLGKSFFIIFFRLVLDGIAAFRFLLQLKPKHFLAVFKAHISFYATLGKVYKKREKTNFILNYALVTSIVWSHFVKRVRNFNILVKD